MSSSILVLPGQGVTPEHFSAKPTEVAAAEAAAKNQNDLPNRVQLTSPRHEPS